MKTELHTHTHPYSSCAVDSVETILKAMIRAGYGAVYLTEHERVWTHTEMRLLQQTFPQIRIFPGVELSLDPAGSTHMLVLGTTDQEYIWLQYEPEAVLQKARQENNLTVLCHPFRWTDTAELLKYGPLPDAMEYRTNNHQGEMAERSLRAAAKCKLPLVNSGDIHAVRSINRFYIETEYPLEHPCDIRPLVMGGRYTLVPPEGVEPAPEGTA